jgi:hypothetical protein
VEGWLMAQQEVHMATAYDVAARCGEPLEPGSVRATHPDHVTCGACIEAYLAGDDKTDPPRPRSFADIPKEKRKLYALAFLGIVGVLAVLAVALGPGSSGSDTNTAITPTVTDCNQTEFEQPKNGGPLQPVRVAEIQFVNTSDQQQTFTVHVGGVVPVLNGKPATYTLSPHGTQIVTYVLDPQIDGTSVGDCYALNVRATN